MSNFDPTIGLEIHIVLNTNTKMFSPSLSRHENGVNTHLNEIDLALPGTLPSVNENAVKKAIRLAHALHMQIHTNPITFDRKSYYYWDLPKSFQITQQYNPIGTDGYVLLDDEKHTKVTIERIQMEEDTAKQIKIENSNDVWLNYNRSGMPLIEIVSNPVLHSAKEVELYLNALREICLFMDVSDAKMEEGSMRVDVNVSVAKANTGKFGTKVEIKNINSIANAATAVQYEINRQSALLAKGEIVEQETRRFDDVNQTTVFMRKKVDAVDYKYMTETNILAIHTPKEFVEEVLKHLPPHPYELRQSLRNDNIAEKDINILLSDKAIYTLFNEVYAITNDYKDAIRWVLNELQGSLNKQEKSIDDLTKKQRHDLIELIKDYKENKFNTKQAKALFKTVFEENKDYQLELEHLLNTKKDYDEDSILKLINDILATHPETKTELTTRFERAEKFITGQLMKISQGQIDPQKVKELLQKIK